jgi:hypothetical protein
MGLHVGHATIVATGARRCGWARSRRNTCRPIQTSTSENSSVFDADDTLMVSSLAVIAGQGRYPLLNFSSGGMPEPPPMAQSRPSSCDFAAAPCRGSAISHQPTRQRRLGNTTQSVALRPAGRSQVAFSSGKRLGDHYHKRANPKNPDRNQQTSDAHRACPEPKQHIRLEHAYLSRPRGIMEGNL